MATKEKLLQLLQTHRETYLSGEEIADSLGVSRAAVCKAAKSLRDQGYPIHAVTNRGYCLSGDADIISTETILSLLHHPMWQLKALDSLPSTNSFLRDLANQGAPEGTVILASCQTQGRGRMGRSFYSPQDTGLYLSLLLRPRDLSPRESLQITTMAASALCLSVEEATGLSPKIKWVNDLYLKGKKICGILTEASFSMETGMLEDAVLGLGLNLYPPAEGFPPALSSIAGALLDGPRAELKNRITAGFLNHFGDFYLGRKFEEAAEIYRSRSLLTGKQILVGEEKRPATVLTVTDRCQLLVRYEDGSQQALSYGEVSIVNCI